MTLSLFDSGIGYGGQLMAQYLGGEVTAAGKDTAREYGKTQTWFDTDCRLFRGLPEQSITWMSHGDYMATLARMSSMDLRMKSPIVQSPVAPQTSYRKLRSMA